MLINGWGPHVSCKDHTSHKISFPEVFLRFYEITSVGKGYVKLIYIFVKIKTKIYAHAHTIGKHVDYIFMCV